MAEMTTEELITAMKKKLFSDTPLSTRVHDAVINRLAELAAEVEWLRGKLPKTADGVWVIPGTPTPLFIDYGPVVKEIDAEYLEWSERGHWIAAWGGPHHDAVGMEDIYSTPEAAEAARNADNTSK